MHNPSNQNNGSTDPVQVEELRAGHIAVLDKAIAEVGAGNTSAHWEPDVLESATWLLSYDRPSFYKRRTALKKVGGQNVSLTAWTKEVNGGKGSASESQVDELTDLIESKVKTFHDAGGNCFASIDKDGHRETWSIKSKGFCVFVSYTGYKELGRVPTEAIIKAVTDTLAGKALHDGEEIEAYLRCAALPCGGYMIDMGDKDWRAFEVTPEGCKIVARPDVRFVRSGTSAPFPEPDFEGDVNLLWKHVNIPKDFRILALAFVLESYRPDTPYALLELCGEQGSAKSSTHKRFSQLIDPSTAPLKAPPRKVEDAFLSLANNYLSSFENVSNLSPAIQDALCVILTGGASATRKLYTDTEESVISVKGPVIINGIRSVVTRSDLIDRSVKAVLPRIRERKPESELEADFERDYPKILGGMLTLFSKTLKLLPSVKLDSLPRMADFAILGEAMSRVRGDGSDFTAVYEANRTESLQDALEASPIALALQDFMMEEKAWQGTHKELKAELEKPRYKHEGDGWPKSARGLRSILDRQAPNLRAVGIEIESLPKTRLRREIRIYVVGYLEEDDTEAF